jgi:dynein heavy chain
LILTKIIRPEITVEAMTQYVHDTIGEPFLNTDAVQMQIVYDDTTNKIPLIFILSVGADPLQSILRLAREKGKKTEEVATISLGQGQGPAA